MITVSYWWFFAIFWLTCGVIGYSMVLGRLGRKPWLMGLWKSKGEILRGCLAFGPVIIVVALRGGWTESDGMWL